MKRRSKKKQEASSSGGDSSSKKKSDHFYIPRKGVGLGKAKGTEEESKKNKEARVIEEVCKNRHTQRDSKVKVSQ